MRKRQFVIVADLPDDINAAEFRSYMRIAIESWSGNFPNHPLFGWFHDRITGPSRRLRIRSVSEADMKLLHKIRANRRYGRFAGHEIDVATGHHEI